MTSYSHYNDEAFKIYVAQKIGEGSKFVVLQHGHQGHHELCGTFYEKRICDNYISWGNKDFDKKTIPLFITTNVGKKLLKKFKGYSNKNNRISINSLEKHACA